MILEVIPRGYNLITNKFHRECFSTVERKVIGSIGMDLDRGGGGGSGVNIRGNQRIRESTELLQKRVSKLSQSKFVQT